jgi:hypothetical protein
MKKNFLIFIGAAAIVAVLFVLRTQKPKIPVAQDQLVSESTNSAPPGISGAPLATPASASVQASNPGVPQQITDAETRYRQGLISKEQAVQEIMLERNKQPLDLYGKVVDQSGAPVVGAKVEGSVLLNVDVTRSGGETHVTHTDSEGRFNFIGLHGVKLGISPQKEGYLYDLKLPSRRPDDYEPDPNNPVVFTMWKLQGAEPLTHTGFKSRVPYDGTPAVFSLQTGKKITDGNGDLRISLTRTPSQVRRGLDKYDWKAAVEIPGGGILPENDPYPYLASETGYLPKFETNMSSNAVPWESELRQNFYFRNPQGQYGRLTVDLSTGSTRPDTGITVEASINPTGSRNLETDFQK